LPPIIQAADRAPAELTRDLLSSYEVRGRCTRRIGSRVRVRSKPLRATFRIAAHISPILSCFEALNRFRKDVRDRHERCFSLGD